MMRRRGARWLALVPACMLGAVLAPLAGALPSTTVKADAPAMPPIGHVWVINLENENLSSTFQDPTDNPYMAGTLPAMGALLTQYYGVGHNSLDNYVAQISGQAPNNDTEGDCVSGDWAPSSPPLDPNGQAIGQGCVFPPNVLTIADQLDPGHTDMRGVTWKGYMEDMGVDAFNDAGVLCAHYPSSAVSGGSGGADPADKYVQKHNPFVYFRSLVDKPGYCEAHDVPLGDLHRDLQDVATTPMYSMITAGLQNDGHDSSAGAIQFGITADRWLREVIPTILASPAYRQDGMIVLTSDEGVLVTTGSGAASTGAGCCNEQPGPNYPAPGGDTGGPGGGEVGAVILSPFVKPGTVVSPDPGSAGCTPATCTGPGYYNHYSLLRTVEDIFHTSGGTDGSGHLGFAGSSATYAGPGEFGCEVFTAYAGCPPNGQPAQPTASAPASGLSTGPRTADGSSSWLNPAPQGNDLAAVDCSVGTTCVAVGKTGSILRSADAGATWARRPSGSATDLDGVSCVGSGTCVAVGSHGSVLHSADGGSTWTPSTASAANGKALNAVTCRADGLCLAAGDAGTVLRSTDGGSTWQSQATNTGDPLTGAACVPGTAVASTTCIATGPFDFLNNHNALRSIDGGATWSQIAIGTVMHRLRSISCPTATLCFTAGDGGYVAWSTDGASTWKDTGNPIDDSDAYLGAACSDVTKFACFSVGEHFHTSASSAAANNPWGAVALATADGGQTFTPSWPGTSQSLLAASCTVGHVCVSVGARGTILRSPDGGKTWLPQTAGAESPISQVSCPPRVHASDGHTYQMSPVCQRDSYNSLRAVTCPAAQTCYAAGDNGTVISTDDGFAHWTVRAADSNPASSTPTSKPVSLSGIACASMTHCVAVGSYGTILATTDGATWKAQASHTVETLQAVSCTALGQCVAVGDHGVILSSPDGATWAAVTSPVEVTLDGVSCPAANLCVAVGTGGALLTGAVSGTATWALQHAPASLSLSAVSCSSATACTAVGSGGAALTTVDAGVDWTARKTGVGDQLDGVACLSASVCVATGSQGTQVDSGDGGSTWTAPGTGTNRAVLAVACPTTTCYEVGEAGAILSTTAPAATAQSVSITVNLQPSTIAADGLSTTTATATVLGADGHGLPGQVVTFSRSSSGAIVPNPATDNGDGTYTTRLTAATTPGQETVTASTGGATATALLIETSGGALGGGLPVPPGYWTVASDGGVFSFGSAVYHGSASGLRLNAPVVGMAPTADRGGYWLAAADGGVFSFGSAQFHGSASRMHLNAPVVGIAAAPDGGGYWLAAADGGVFSFGTAQFHGSVASMHLNAPVVGIAAAPDGGGYWLVGADGGVFSFGTALFHGSMGGKRLNAHMVGIAGDGDGGGYWLAGADGGVFTFGDATYHGSAGSLRLQHPVTGIGATAGGGGYWLVASDGRLFAYGDAEELGSMSGIAIVGRMLGVASA